MKHDILIKRRIAVVGVGKGHKYPRIWLPRDIVETLGITNSDMEVYVTLYENGFIKIQRTSTKHV